MTRILIFYHETLLPEDVGGRRPKMKKVSTQSQEAVESSSLLETSSVKLMLSLGFLPSQEMSELQKSPSNSSTGSAARGIFLLCSGLILHFLTEASPLLLLNAFLKLFPPTWFRTFHWPLVTATFKHTHSCMKSKGTKNCFCAMMRELLSFAPWKSGSSSSSIASRPLR